ncbi:hypothetical protein HZA43_01570 [Candidatus Peregrinibacteria bacterium]|nr:hypothetical protein [Candidatus Peregrinibacteria bacterium]
MLKAIFSSKARIKLLNLFLLNPDEEFFIRELTRKLDEQINSIRRELDNLKRMGLLRSKMNNRKKYFLVNKGFIIYPELRSIMMKAMNNEEDIAKKLAKIGEVDLLVLSGIFVGIASPSDILIVGDIDKEKLKDYVGNELKSKKDLKYTAMSRKDFLYRLECNDRFILDMIKNDQNIIAINKLRKELEKRHF